MGKYFKLFSTDAERIAYEDGETYLEPYVSCVEGNNEVHYNKPPFFCKLILNNSETVEIEGSGELTQAMVSDQYRQTLIGAEIGELCTSIANHAFSACDKLTSITISNNVTSIGATAFQYCFGLTNVTISNGVTSIDQQAFLYCSGLTSVTIGDSVTSIGEGAFSFCSGLTSISFGSGVTSIGNGVFYGCRVLNSIVSLATTAPTITDTTFRDVKTGGTLTVPQGSTGYNTWMGTGNYYLGKYNWTKVEQ